MTGHGMPFATIALTLGLEMVELNITLGFVQKRRGWSVIDRRMPHWLGSNCQGPGKLPACQSVPPNPPAAFKHFLFMPWLPFHVKNGSGKCA
jgi:hypothetical protein